MSSSDLLASLQASFIGLDTEYPTVNGGRGPRIYLDSAASTLMMAPAFDVGHEFLVHYASTHSDLHFAARGASHAFEWAHQRVLEFVDANPEHYSAFFAGSGPGPKESQRQSIITDRKTRDQRTQPTFQCCK